MHTHHMTQLSDLGRPGYRRGLLLVPSVVGAALLIFVVSSYEDAWASVLSNVGVALFLFSILYWFQKRIEQRIIEGIQILSSEDLERRRETEIEDPLMPGDFLQDYGPLQTAVALIGFIEKRDLTSVWRLSDPNLRLCRAQAWVFNNVTTLGLSAAHSESWDNVARYLVSGPHEGEELWDGFAKCEADQLFEAFRHYFGDAGGWSQRRRVVGPRHEVILITRLPEDAPQGYVVTKPLMVESSVELLLVCVDDHRSPLGRRYQVSAYTRHMPLPGWPPTWWITDDPVAVQSHPGVSAA